jgi:hypothetical protein
MQLATGKKVAGKSPVRGPRRKRMKIAAPVLRTEEVAQRRVPQWHARLKRMNGSDHIS